jgi:hypothetical protein
LLLDRSLEYVIRLPEPKQLRRNIKLPGSFVRHSTNER